jgi:two-component system, chemotaxis family, sensor kinase CheA
MDMRQYMGVFVAECRELLESLNLSIVELERADDPAATIDEIFRVAHSFKGISSTMGYEQMAGLTHELEHLLDIVRGGGRAVDEQLVTMLLQSLDVLEQAVDSIEQDGTEGIDPAALVVQLRALAGPGDTAAPTQAAAAEPPAAGMLPDPASLPAGIQLLHVQVAIDPGCDATSIRAYMAYAAVEDVAEPVWALPTAEDLDEWDRPTLDMLVVREHEGLAAELLAALQRIPELASFDVRPYDGASSTEQSPAKTPSAGATPAPAGSNGAAGSDTVRQRRSGTVRVDAERLDSLMHQMGEVVVHRSAVEACLRDRDLDSAAAAIQHLRRATQALQAEVMRVRMVPVESALMRMPRLVRDLSAKLGKQVDLKLTGAETEIDRSVVDALAEPLVHLVRNGIDHGIEPPSEREAAGKPAAATLRIAAGHEGGNVVISVADDGRGIDPDRIRAHAVERGIIDAQEAALLDDAAVVELLFEPGFSTAQVATDVSGRGVGMDAVRAMCREWGGEVELESRHGLGSVARIRIPLTLAVMNVLVVRAGSHDVAIPIDRIERTVRLVDLQRADLGEAQRMVRLHDDVLEELDLGEAVGYGRDDDAVFGVIVHGAGTRRVVLSVGGLVGEHEAVTRSLPGALGHEPVFMGAAVQGDGSVVLIVDCDYLVEHAASATMSAGRAAHG